MTEPAASPETGGPAAATPPPAAAPAQDAPAPAATPGGLPGKRFLVLNATALGVGLVFLVAALVLPRGAQGSAPGPAGTFGLALWDDGKAEVSRYKVSERLDGKVASFERVQIVVHELYDPVRHTRADKGTPGAIDSIQLVQVDDVPTGHADSCRRTLAVRVARSEPARLLEASLGTQQWSGNTFARVVPRSGDLFRQVCSSREGEGDREDTLPAGTLLEDQLALTLRTLDLKDPASRELSILPTLVSRGQPLSQPVKAKVSPPRLSGPSLPGGATAELHVERSDGVSTTYWLDDAEPHVLKGWKSSDGREGKLESTSREAY